MADIGQKRLLGADCRLRIRHRLRQSRLCALALGDIKAQPMHPLWLAQVVVLGPAVALDPADLATGQHHPELIVQGLVVGNPLIQHGAGALQIIGVQALVPGCKGDVPGVRDNAVHRQRLRRPGQGVGGQIPLPGARVGGALGEGEALVGLAQGLLLGLAFGNVQIIKGNTATGAGIQPRVVPALSDFVKDLGFPGFSGNGVEKARFHLRAQGAGKGFPQPLAKDILAAQSKHGPRLVVEIHDPPLFITGTKAIGNAVEGGIQLLLRTLEVRNVVDDAKHQRPAPHRDR